MAPPSLVLLLALVAGSMAALPKGWKACNRSSKDYEGCLKKEIVAAVRTLMNGEKKLGVHSLDPLRIDSLEIPQNPGPVNLNLAFKNLDIIGIKELSIMSIKNDWKKLNAAVKIPDVYVLGDYKVDGKVLVLPITGNGKCNLTFHDLVLKADVDWKEMTKGGKKYFQMEKMKVHLVPQHLYITLTNLFNGDKALGDNMNVFLNENWDQILAELNPGISDALSQAFKQISNSVLSKIPADDIDKK